MTFGRVALLVGVAVGVTVVGVVISILYMVVYGHAIDPGHDQAYYNAHIQVAGPYIGIVAGMPLMFLAGWWVAGWDVTMGVRSAMIVWVTSAVIDVAVLVAVGPNLRGVLMVAISIVTKLAAIYFGAVAR
jgi:hypothetical protein